MPVPTAVYENELVVTSVYFLRHVSWAGQRNSQLRIFLPGESIDCIQNQRHCNLVAQAKDLLSVM